MPECEYNFCDIARTLGENTFRRPCNFKELRAVKRAHITTLRYVPDGSLCTASGEQIFPRDSVQRNCFKLALYTTRDHDCIASPIASVRVFKTVCDADVGSLRSVRSHRSIHCWHGHAARRSALPRERFSPLARNGHADCIARCPLSGCKAENI